MQFCPQRLTNRIQLQDQGGVRTKALRWVTARSIAVPNEVGTSGSGVFLSVAVELVSAHAYNFDTPYIGVY